MQNLSAPVQSPSTAQSTQPSAASHLRVPHRPFCAVVHPPPAGASPVGPSDAVVPSTVPPSLPLSPVSFEVLLDEHATAHPRIARPRRSFRIMEQCAAALLERRKIRPI